jgi:hypothetical protein
MKIKIFPVATTLAMALTSTIAFSDPLSVSVVNHWQQVVNVKEGSVFSLDAKLSPGESLFWRMGPFDITFLQITYLKDGYWRLVPNCPFGHYSQDIKVSITGTLENPNIPTCHTI